MKPATIRRHLKRLRAECIEGTDDLVLKRIAYEMEMAVRRCTEKTVGWPSLPDLARQAATMLRNELKLSSARHPQDGQP